MFFLGLIYSSVGLLLAWWVFHAESSLIMVFLTAIASVIIMYNTLIYEEKFGLSSKSELKILKHHSRALLFFVFLFFGFFVAYALWYFFLPPQQAASLFRTQIQTIVSINQQTGIVGSYFNASTFLSILSNNLRVLFFCIVFSFFYGSGAIFILAWNASVMGVAMGNFMRNIISKFALLVGWQQAAVYFHAFSLGLLRYLVHGIPEVLAYFMGGLAGGLISVGLIKKHYRSARFVHVLVDALDLISLSIVLLVAAAFLEVIVLHLV